MQAQPTINIAVNEALVNRIEELTEALDRANSVLRSAYAIAEREGKDVSSWAGFRNRIDRCLKEQRVILEPRWRANMQWVDEFDE